MPNGPPKAPKWILELSQMEPKGDHLDPKCNQMDPKGTQTEPKVAPRETKSVPKTPKGSQEVKIYIHKLPINRPSGQLLSLPHLLVEKSSCSRSALFNKNSLLCETIEYRHLFVDFTRDTFHLMLLHMYIMNGG